MHNPHNRHLSMGGSWMPTLSRKHARGIWFLACTFMAVHSHVVSVAQSTSEMVIDRLVYDIMPGEQRIRIAADGGRILRLKNGVIPRVLIDNPDIISAHAIAKNEIQLSGQKPGVTRISIWDGDKNVYSVLATVYRDGLELQEILDEEFPTATLRVRPLETSVVLSGWVDDPESIGMIVRMAEDYYPKVLNNLRVGNNQQVMLHVRVMEISRTKLRRLGVDWASFGDSDFVAQSVSGLISETTSNAQSIIGAGGSTVTLGVTSAASSFFAVVDALRQHDLGKVLAEPVLTTISGRAASFDAGGEFPILVPQGLGTVAVEYKTFGTRIDVVPIVLGDGNIRLEVRPQISEIDNARGVDINGVRVPGLRSRKVDTAVEMKAGQTLALAGLIQERVESQNRGLPILSDLPLAGTLFRRVVNSVNEVELLIMVRPELVSAMDPSETPLVGPGMQSGIPNNHELYLHGQIETFKCDPDVSCFNQIHSEYPTLYDGTHSVPSGVEMHSGVLRSGEMPVEAMPGGVIGNPHIPVEVPIQSIDPVMPTPTMAPPTVSPTTRSPAPGQLPTPMAGPISSPGVMPGGVPNMEFGVTRPSVAVRSKHVAAPTNGQTPKAVSLRAASAPIVNRHPNSVLVPTTEPVHLAPVVSAARLRGNRPPASGLRTIAAWLEDRKEEEQDERPVEQSGALPPVPVSTSGR